MFDIVLPIDHPSSKTKAVVVIYGWLGCVQKHLQKYANLYADKGCAVVYGSAEIIPVVRRNELRVTEVAVESVMRANAIIRDIEMQMDAENEAKIPVILHYFSNGGAFVVGMLKLLVDEAKKEQPLTNNTNTSTQTSTSSSTLDLSMANEVKFFSERLYERGYEILDSAPAYLHDETLYRAIETAIPKNLFLQALIKSIAYVINSINGIFLSFQKKDSVTDRFWKNAIENDTCLRQVYIYSIADKITDSIKIDELIEERKKRGISILSFKFEDSDHVLHMKKYPKQYNDIVDQVIEAVCSSLSHTLFNL